MVDLTKNDDPPQTPSVPQAENFGKREDGNQPTQAPPIKPKRKLNAIPPRTLNADPLAQFIGMDAITEALIDDVPTKVLLDMGTTIDLMPISYAKAAGLEVKSLSLITDNPVTMSLAAGQYSEAVGYTEFNLKIPGVSGYDMDRLALLSEDDSNYSKRVPVTLGTNSIMYAMKEGKIELLDEVWKQTKTQRSFAKLWELVGFCQAAITCAEKQGIEPLQFKITPFILIRGWKIHWILMKSYMQLTLSSYSLDRTRSSRVRHPYTKDQPVVIQKGTPVSHMVTANAVPEKVLLSGILEALDKPKTEKAQQLSIEE